MPLQLSDAQFRTVAAILARTSKRLVSIHRAYAEGRLAAVHVKQTRHIRNAMGVLLAQFEDGMFHGSIEPDMVNAMRIFEAEANALLCSIYGVDDAREMVA